MPETLTHPDRMTQAELLAELHRRFGPDPKRWAFVCPSCGDIATGQDFKDALAEHPRTNRDGSKTTTSDIIGQECIGRTLGALRKKHQSNWNGRGCDWAAYGLFCGPVTVVLPEGREMHAFRLADPSTPALLNVHQPVYVDEDTLACDACRTDICGVRENLGLPAIGVRVGEWGHAPERAPEDATAEDPF